MVRNVLLLCLLGITFSFVTNCVAHEAIINGERAEVDQCPYQISLQFESRRHFCGGGIINEYFIISAAHCFFKDDHSFENRTILVVAGTNNLRRADKPAVIVEIEKVIVPDKFKTTNVLYVADIAVAKLTKPLELSKHIQKLELPKDKLELYHGKTAVVAGFGWQWIVINNDQEHGGRNDSRLRFSEVDVLKSIKIIGPINLAVSGKYVYAQMKQPDHSKPRGLCLGDSGSPLVHDNIVIGIASRTGLSCSEVKKGSIYTNVAHYLDFVKIALEDKPHKDVRIYIPHRQPSF